MACAGRSTRTSSPRSSTACRTAPVSHWASTAWSCWRVVRRTSRTCSGCQCVEQCDDRCADGLNELRRALVYAAPSRGHREQWISSRPQRRFVLLPGKTMSASIALAHLSWSTPEGRPLLSELDLSFTAERTGLVGRNGVGKTTLLKLIAGEAAPQAGRVSVNGTLGVLRQTVQVGAE